MKSLLALFGLGSLVGLIGCSVGPNYHAPKVATPGNWSEVGNGGSTNSPAQLARWWRNFQDPMLDSLVDRAVKSNLDLKMSEARVRAARALQGRVLSDFLPTIDGNASYSKERRSKNALTSSGTNQKLDTDTYQLGFDASWEIDVFGGQRRALEAARANLAAIEADYLDVLVSMLGDVARYYIDVRGYQRRIKIARDNIQSQQEAVDITRLRFNAGLASELDVSQATAVLETTKADVPTLETSLQQSIHRLGVLLGLTPEALVSELSREAPIPLTPPSVPVGLPADLVRRRPDIRSSERQLAAANAEIGVATAELFPKFFLTGAAGFQSLHTSDLISPASKFWSAGPSVVWRLLEYPRIKSTISAQTAQQEQALAFYGQTVLTSLEEVENALVAYGKEQERWHSLTEAVKANRHALELANELYTKGIGDFLNVLVTARALYQIEDQCIQSERTVSVNLVSLYKALGGGWETELNTSKR